MGEIYPLNRRRPPRQRWSGDGTAEGAGAPENHRDDVTGFLENPARRLVYETQTSEFSMNGRLLDRFDSTPRGLKIFGLDLETRTHI